MNSLSPVRPVPYLARLAAGWKNFFLWWTAELVTFLPESWRESAQDHTDDLLLAIQGDEISARLFKAGRWIEVARRPLPTVDSPAQSAAIREVITQARQSARQPVSLAIPLRQVVQREVQLPLAAEEALRNVLQFELDRYTPFRADQVYFDARVVNRSVPLGQIGVRMAVAPRALVDAALERLRRAQVAVSAVVVQDDLKSGEPALNLLPPEQRARRGLGLGQLNTVLLFLVVALGLAAIALPIVIKRQASIELIPLVERADRQTAAVERLRDRVQAAQAQYNLLIQKKQRHPSTILLLDELTRLLPDDTWVQQLSLNGTNLQIQGDTGSSSKLIGLIENSHILRGANFLAPLTKGQGTNSEHYQLGAEVRPMPPSEVTPTPVQASPAAQPHVKASNETLAAKTAQTSGAAASPQIPAQSSTPDLHRVASAPVLEQGRKTAFPLDSSVPAKR